ncbi:MAG: hypothetical protein QOI66_2481, partial [Myxococcales bacterium]|nr:hypothetical protein [Myxococcales bacterium]
LIGKDLCLRRIDLALAQARASA